MEEALQMILLPDLFEFAYVPNWFDHLIALAEMAVPESWCFTNPILPPRNTDTPILEKYVNCVFRKQFIDFNNFNYVSNPEYGDRIFTSEMKTHILAQVSTQRDTRASMDASPAISAKTRSKTGFSEGFLTILRPI